MEPMEVDDHEAKDLGNDSNIEDDYIFIFFFYLFVFKYCFLYCNFEELFKLYFDCLHLCNDTLKFIYLLENLFMLFDCDVYFKSSYIDTKC